MPRRGENIRKRKDNRWEGRYIKEYDLSGKAKYASVYAYSYLDVKKKLAEAKITIINSTSPKNAISFREVLFLWIEHKRSEVKEQTYVRYLYIIENHILPEIRKMPISQVTNDFINSLLIEKRKHGRLDGKGGLSASYTQTISFVLNSAVNYAVQMNYCSPIVGNKIKIQKKKCHLEVLSLREQAACEVLGIDTLPVIVKEMTREEAIITMVDSNIQREHILPSEKAKAYKMKLDALKHQGITSRQVGEKWSVTQVSETANGSERQIQRYIRLTNLNKQLLDMVDEGRIAFTPAVELSYLNEIEQQDLVEAISECDATPNLSQACRFKKMSAEQGLTPESITEVLNEQKANQKPMFKIYYEKLQAVAPKIKQIDFEAFVIKACEHYYKYQQKQQSRDAR